MRVVLVTESFPPSVTGVARCASRTVDHLVARGVEVLVVAPGPGDRWWGPTPVVRTVAVPLPVCRDFPLGMPSRAVRRRVEEFRPDVVHVASPVVLGAWGLRLAQALDLPSVAVFQTDLAGFAQQYRLGAADRPLWWWLRRVHRRAGRTLAPSRPTMRDLRVHGVPRLHRWPRGVDGDAFSPVRRARPAAADVGSVRVGYVGRLAREKRVERLAHVAVLPGSHLQVVGSGPDRPRLERLLPGAHFTGRLQGDALGRAYADLDVFVHTGTHETYCQAIQEAMASGVPVVAPARGGPLDLVTHGVTGLLWRPDRPQDIRGLVAQLVAEPATRARMGAAARAAVEARTWEVVGDQLLVHYRALLAGRPGRGVPMDVPTTRAA